MDFEGVGSYEVFSKSTNWASANESAEALGGHLAIITSQAEWELVKKLPGLKQGMLIGATDEDEEGTWKWVDGQPLAGQDRQPETFHAWGGNEPNNTGGVENYAVVWDWQDTFHWNDSASATGYVVEFPGISYQLVDGEGSTDNAFFTISENKLKTAIGFNFETKPSHSIRIKATDSAGLSFEKSLTVSVTDANDTPIGITIDNNKIDENLKKGTTIGNLSAIDEDTGDRHTYKLIFPDDIESPPPFVITGSTLKTTAPLDFETQSLISLMVEATDDSTATFRQFISVEVGNVNEAPTAIGLDKGDYAEVLENQPKDTFVSLISTVDPESEDTHTYRITGGADKSLFAISGIELYTKAPLDYETKPVLDIIIEAKDPGGLTYEQQLEVRVLNANDPPTDISVNQTSFPENLEIGSFIAELSATDSEINRGFEVISGRFNWDQANEDAQSKGGHLATFSSEEEWNEALEAISGTENGQHIWIGATDTEKEGDWKWVTGEPWSWSNWRQTGNPEPNGGTRENWGEFEFGNANTWNDMMNIAGRADIGDFHYLLEKSFTYNLVAGEGDTHNEKFSIQGNQLIAKTPVNYETGNQFSIRIEVTDSGGLKLQKEFELTAVDAPDAPTDILLSKAPSMKTSRRGL